MGSVIATILLLGLIAWLVGFLPFPDSFKRLIQGVLLIAAVLYVLALAVGFPVPAWLSVPGR